MSFLSIRLSSSLINSSLFFLQLIETSPPDMSTSGNPIKYGPVTENPLIGHNAPSVQNFLKGKTNAQHQDHLQEHLQEEEEAKNG